MNGLSTIKTEFQKFSMDGSNKIAFISGHRDITQEEFQKNYVPAIMDHAMSSGWFVVGDCDGCDKMAAEFIADIAKILPNAIHLTIYHMFDTPRFEIELKDTRNPESSIDYIGYYETDIERDFAMTKDSDFDIAFIRDKSKWKSGTAQNLLRRHTMKND